MARIAHFLSVHCETAAHQFIWLPLSSKRTDRLQARTWNNEVLPSIDHIAMAGDYSIDSLSSIRQPPLLMCPQISPKCALRFPTLNSRDPQEITSATRNVASHVWKLVVQAHAQCVGRNAERRIHGHE